MDVKIDVMVASGVSKKGSRRHENEDRFLIKAFGKTSLLLAVSDGLGGNPAGGKAAEEVIHVLSSLTNEEKDNSLFLRTAVNMADRAIRKRVENHPELEGMGATVTAAILTSRMVWWVHIGDSRMYLLRKGILQQITRDHTFLQDLVDSGDVSEEEVASHPVAHMLDQCVGCIDAGVDSGTFPIFPGDTLLLCTDGVYRSVSIKEMRDILSIVEGAEDFVNQTVKNTSQKVFSDDATVIIASA